MCLCFGKHDFVSLHHKEEDRAECFAFIILWMSCYCKHSMFFLRASWAGLQCAIVLFPDHSHVHFIWLL